MEKPKPPYSRARFLNKDHRSLPKVREVGTDAEVTLAMTTDADAEDSEQSRRFRRTQARVELVQWMPLITRKQTIL